MQSFVVITAVAVLHTAVPATATVAASASNIAAYEAFRHEYGRTSSQDSDGITYETRLALFEARRKAVMEHNRQPGTSWIAKVNKFADYTDAEQQAMLGYRRVGQWWTDNRVSSSLLEVGPEKQIAVAKTVDWRTRLKTSGGFLREQGSCGSCWAVAAAGAIEMHAELWSKPTGQLSYAQLVDCTPNKRHCGGAGGCQGATAELAFEYAKTHAIMDAEAYAGYGDGNGNLCAEAAAQGHVVTQGFIRLATNKVGPLLEAVASTGPVVISADASGWSPYSSGIFDDCPRNATVNHAILLMGFGIDPKLGGKLYWLVRNSWGGSWGEDGHIRILRHESDVGEAGHCGMDNDPQEGVGCDGGPKMTPVCGMCGMLADSSFPKGVQSTSGHAVMIRGHRMLGLSGNTWWNFMGT